MMNHLPSSWFNKTSNTSRMLEIKSYLSEKRTWFCVKNQQEETLFLAAFYFPKRQRNYKMYNFLRIQQFIPRACQGIGIATEMNESQVEEIMVAYVNCYQPTTFDYNVRV